MDHLYGAFVSCLKPEILCLVLSLIAHKSRTNTLINISELYFYMVHGPSILTFLLFWFFLVILALDSPGLHTF